MLSILLRNPSIGSIESFIKEKKNRENFKIFIFLWIMFFIFSQESIPQNDLKSCFIRVLPFSIFSSKSQIISFPYCFGVVNTECQSESINQGRSYFDVNIEIAHCSFNRLSQFSGNGGVICISSGSLTMCVSYSMFYSCICASHGGAIYFYSTNSSLKMICANKCSCGSSSEGHFAWLTASQVNIGDYISFSLCSQITSGYYSIRFNTGDQRVDNTNSSMNCDRFVSGIGFISPSSFTSSLCTLSNNRASDGICIAFSTNSGTMSSANIIQNNSPTIYGVVRGYEGTPKMIYCIFQDNQNTLFYVEVGSLEVYHSYIDHYELSLSKLLPVLTSINNTFAKTKTYQIRFFSSHHCNADLSLMAQIETKRIDRAYMHTYSSLSPVIILMLNY